MTHPLNPYRPDPTPAETFPDPEHPVWKMVNQFPGTELGDQAWAAFERELPELLLHHQGQWVAYHGGQRIGVGPRNTELYEDCLRRGLVPEEQCVICQIEPSEGMEVLGLGGCTVEYEDQE
jgi:hypothetical protein